jgi:hypothetical protein
MHQRTYERLSSEVGQVEMHADKNSPFFLSDWREAREAIRMIRYLVPMNRLGEVDEESKAFMRALAHSLCTETGS